MKESSPTAWDEVELGQLAEFRNGVNYTKDNFGTGVRVINVKDFQDYSMPHYQELSEINPENVVRPAHLLHENDIVFVRSNGNKELIGRSMMVRSFPGRPVTHSAFTIRVRFTSTAVDPRFYSYVFRSGLIRQVLSAHGSGTNISNLNQDILSRLRVPLPPLPTQRRIASILSAYDDLIENNTRRIAIMEEMARRLYDEWFVQFRFSGHEDVPMVDSEIGKVPEGWEVVRLEDVAAFIGRGISPKYDDEADCRVINQKCIRDQRLNMDLSRRQSKNVRENKVVRFGDVLINSTGVGTLGRVAQVYEPLENTTVDSHVTIARAEEAIDLDYFGQQLLSLQPHFEGQGVGATGQTELSRGRVAETSFIQPPCDLQEQFGDIVRPMKSLCTRLAAKNTNLRTQRDLLLPKLISGEIDVSEVGEPSEEAAA